MAFSNKIVDFLHLISPKFLKPSFRISYFIYRSTPIFIFELTFAYYFAIAKVIFFAYSLIAASISNRDMVFTLIQYAFLC